jgi:hypothetical protein
MTKYSILLTIIGHDLAYGCRGAVVIAHVVCVKCETIWCVLGNDELSVQDL